MEKCYPGVTRLPGLFQRDLLTKQVRSDRGVPRRLGGSPFFDDRVTLRAGRANFSPCNYLTHSAGVYTVKGRDNQCM